MNSTNDFAGAGASVQAGTLAYMMAARRWLIWAPDKQPFYVDGTPRRGTLDSGEDSARLASFDEASRAVQNSGGQFAGVGLALGSDGNGGQWQGIDLDNVQKNQLADLANALPGYVEVSPSGNGCHAIGYGADFPSLGSNGSGTEAYSRARYFTFTGRIIRDGGLCDLSQWVTENLTARHQKHDPASPPGPSPIPVVIDPKTITHLRSALNSIPPNDYHEWIKAGRALHDLGEAGRELWLSWSQQSIKWTPADARKWSTFAGSAAPYQTVFQMAQAHGWVNPNSNAAQLQTRIPTSPLADNIPKPLALMSEHDLDNTTPTDWIVRDVVPNESIGTLFGPSGSFKSFIALDMLAHIANGWRWMGKRVRRMPCVYVPFEGKGGIPKRVRAWREAMYMRRVNIENDTGGNLGFRLTLPKDLDVSRITFVMDPINLREATDRRRLIDALTTAGLTGCVLCIDTLAQASAGIDENSSAMSEIISVFQELQRELHCSVLVVHHTGKNVDLGMRGWSGIRGAMDFGIECRRPDATQQAGVIWLDKLKDAEDGRALAAFSMRIVGLEYDEDGIVTSLVPESHLSASMSEAEVPYAASTAEQDGGDDQFILEWVRQELGRGEFPTGRSLEGQRLHQMRPLRDMTQKRVRDALSRLKAASRIVDSDMKAPSGNKYLCVHETSTA